MPNWVKNKIKFMGNDEENAKILNYIRSENEVESVVEEQYNAIDFNRIIPIPDYIYVGNLGEKERKKYGKNNWYDWCIENWGTKWNTIGTYACENEVFFDTAWDSPVPIFKRLTEIFPNVDMELTYADEDIGSNIGRVTYIDGNFSINRYNAHQDGNDAWEIYIDLWGDEDLEKDESGNWQVKNDE